MKFKFKLDKVLLHRKILEDIAQKDFQEIQAEYNHQLSKLESMQNEKNNARKKSYEMQSQTGGQVLESLKQIHEYILLQDIRIEKQVEVIAQCGKLVEAKREVLRQKAMDTKILRRLEEKKKEQFLEDQRKNEQKELDEMSTMRFDLTRKLKDI